MLLKAIELVAESAPLHNLSRLDVWCELTGVLVGVGEHLFDFVHIHVADFLCQIVLFGFAQPSLELREAIHAAK